MKTWTHKEPDVQKFVFKNCFLIVDHTKRWCETVFPDGKGAPAIPTDDQKDFAREMGYGEDVWKMVWHHEFMHTWLCEYLGMPHSTVLWNVAHGIEDIGEHHFEESRVLIVQRLMQAGMIPELTQKLQ